MIKDSLWTLLLLVTIIEIQLFDNTAAGCPSSCLLVSNTTDIVVVHTDTQTVESLVSKLTRAVALDVDFSKGYIYWSDVVKQDIRRANIDGSNITTLFSRDVVTCDGLAVDWRSGLLYWTDTYFKTIEVADVEANNKPRRVLFNVGLDEPKGIAVDPNVRFLFWTDWGISPKIERSTLSGEDRVSIVTNGLGWPNEIVIDYTSKMLFWVDSKLDKIETANYAGTSRRQLYHKTGIHPFGVAINGPFVYWTDWYTTGGLHKLQITNSQVSDYDVKGQTMGIVMFDQSRQPLGPTACGNNNGGCSHICLPKPGGYRCVCPTGVAIKKDRKTCEKAIYTFLLFADAGERTMNIISLDVDYFTRRTVFYHTGPQHPTAIVYDPVEDKIYWSDVDRGWIASAFRNITGFKVLHQCNVRKPEGLELDRVGRNLYWTDTGTNRIEVGNLDGSTKKALITVDLDEPRDIVVTPEDGKMYWCDWGQKPRIERANMDGTSREVIINSGLKWPNGLSLDRTDKKLYWADANTDKIEQSNLDGSARKTILGGSNTNIHPFGLALHQGYLYWTDWSKRAVMRVNMTSGRNYTVMKGLSHPTGIHVYDPNDKPTVSSPCATNNGGCSDLCLVTPGGFVCACENGITLMTDGRTCDSIAFENRVSGKFLLAAAGFAGKIYRVPVYRPELVCSHLMLKRNISYPVAIAYDAIEGRVYWTDLRLKVVARAFLNGTDVEIIASNNVEEPEGMEIDWISRNLYWTDRGLNTIEVSRLDGSSRRTLIANLSKPLAIALDPVLGVMFWTDRDTSPKIEKANMDGSGRSVILSTDLVWPNGLAIDYGKQHLYWCDGYTSKIWRSDMDGRSRRAILELSFSSFQPFGIALYGDSIYWSDWISKSVHVYNMTSGTNSTLISGLGRLLAIVAYDKSVTLDGSNSCSTANGNCSNICLPVRSSRVCACANGTSLKPNDPTTCEGVIRCPVITVPSHGSILACRNIPGSICYISCDRGYILDGSVSRVCMENGVWAGSGAICRAVTCSPIPVPAHAVLVTTPCINKYDRQCRLGCNTGYKPTNGSIVRACLETGQWNGTLITCTDILPPSFGSTCPDDKYVYAERGFLAASISWREPSATDNSGTLPTVTCNIKSLPYQFSEGTHIVNYVSEDKDGNNSTCSFRVTVKVIRCQPLILPVNETHLFASCSGNHFGSWCNFTCSVGYVIKGISAIQCLSSNGTTPGQWSTNAMPYCEAVTCSALPEPHNGIHIGCTINQSQPYGSICHFSCNLGYLHIGSTKRKCLENGTWSGENFQCKEVKCKPLDSPAFTVVKPTECLSTLSSYGASCTFSCPNGFVIRGTYKRSCGPTGVWSGNNDTNCKDISIPTFGLSCPRDIIAYAGRCGKPALVKWADPIAHDNSGSVKVKYPTLRPPVNLTVGIYKITYSAEDHAANVNNCSFVIQVAERMCVPLVSPMFGVVKLSTCGNRIGSEAFVICKTGYGTSGSTNRTCLANGTWSGRETKCTRITCPTLENLRHGLIKPKLCTLGGRVNYGTTCILKCNVTNGFQHEGAVQTFCNTSSEWNPDPSKILCKDVSPPTLTCPRDVSVKTDAGKSYSTLRWIPPVPDDNSGEKLLLTISPHNTAPPHRFGVGLSKVKYTAIDSSDLESSCTFHVNVTDNESPVALRCPHNVTIVSGKKHSRVYLPQVHFKDNVGVRTVLTDIKNGSLMSWNKYPVKYTAEDTSGNRGICLIVLIIRSLPCFELEPPLNGAKACGTWSLDGTYCTAHCHKGYGFATKVFDLYRCNSNGRWSKAIKISETLYKLPDCSEAHVPQYAFFKADLHYLSDNCAAPGIERKIKENFIRIFKNVFGIMGGCIEDECNIENVHIECQASERRKREIHNENRELHNYAKVVFYIKLPLNVSSETELNSTFEKAAANLEIAVNRSNLDITINGELLSLDKTKTMEIKFVEILCRAGQVPVKLRCVNCPVGYFFNATKNDCDQCPVDQYQDVEAQPRCNACPKGTTTTGILGTTTIFNCVSLKRLENGTTKKTVIIAVTVSASLIVVAFVIIITIRCYKIRQLGFKINLEVKRNVGHGYNNPAFIGTDEGPENRLYGCAENNNPCELNEYEMDRETNQIPSGGQLDPTVLSFENILALQENTDSSC